MGQKKYFRYNIKQLIHSLEFKNKYYYLKNLNLSRYGLCLAEAELLAEIANNYYQNELLEIPENHFNISLYKNISSNKKLNLNDLPKTTVNIPAFSHYELEMYQLRGLQALQTYRIITMLDNIAYQNAMIDINLMAKIVNITPKSIRERITPLLEAGVKIPLTYLSNKWFSDTPSFRYSRALENFFLHNIDEGKVLEKFLISKSEWNFLLFDFFQYTYDFFSPRLHRPLLEEFSIFKKDIVRTSKYRTLTALYQPIEKNINSSTSKKDNFHNTLKHLFTFSNALIIDYLNLLENEACNSNKSRKQGEVIYYAVCEKTVSGTPLNVTELKPITLTFWSSDDNEPGSPYNTTQRKWNKAVRYSLQAQNQCTNLTQYDLSYLLGVSVAVIKNLMKKNRHYHIPTRGNAHDIGPGISHAEQIIKLYLEGYTETEIKFKTGHSYDSIENYLIKFTKVVGLTDMGLNLHQIRLTSKMTYTLARKFMEIFHKYDKHEYTWILTKIRNNFHGNLKKNL